MVKSIMDMLEEEDRIVEQINKTIERIDEYEDIGTIESYIIKKYYNKKYNLEKDRNKILEKIYNTLYKSKKENKNENK